MRHVVSFFAIIGCISADAAASQVRSGGAAAGQPAIRACAVLTKDLVVPFTENKKVLDLFPPEEEVLGTTGRACEYGVVRLQLYPGRGGKGTMSNKEYQPVSGAGESAYFRNNRNQYAELMVWTAKHSFTLQVSVPSGRTADAIKPNVIALANTIITRLP